MAATKTLELHLSRPYRPLQRRAWSDQVPLQTACGMAPMAANITTDPAAGICSTVELVAHRAHTCSTEPFVAGANLTLAIVHRQHALAVEVAAPCHEEHLHELAARYAALAGDERGRTSLDGHQDLQLRPVGPRQCLGRQVRPALQPPLQAGQVVPLLRSVDHAPHRRPQHLQGLAGELLQHMRHGRHGVRHDVPQDPIRPRRMRAAAAVEAATGAARRHLGGELGGEEGGGALLHRRRGEGDAAVPHGAEIESAVHGAVGALPGGVDVGGVVREGAAGVVREHGVGVGHVVGVDAPGAARGGAVGPPWGRRGGGAGRRGPEISIGGGGRRELLLRLLLPLPGPVGREGERELQGVEAGLLPADHGGVVPGGIAALGRGEVEEVALHAELGVGGVGRGVGGGVGVGRRGGARRRCGCRGGRGSSGLGGGGGGEGGLVAEVAAEGELAVGEGLVGGRRRAAGVLGSVGVAEHGRRIRGDFLRAAGLSGVGWG
ncbi:hypothetical protein CFC21_051534 [Triticum aestivum]|uniref:Uncharacterized protein n=1 Tax=Triticum aestivum TaxID=4565 RepID=A0A9R1G7T9_WHEAT|nr:hypothetical protein CFC21_051534 [Triticum aestivum]